MFHSSEGKCKKSKHHQLKINTSHYTAILPKSKDLELVLSIHNTIEVKTN